jgi:transitional endoplasmic reticulum ATPase
MYDDARAEREVPGLFRLDAPGVILFDDFDAALRDRSQSRDPDKQSTFLAELDGVQQKTGLVFLFTSNAKLEELDPAMCRPGRLDVVIHFPKPDAALRSRLILTRWHPDLIEGVDLESVLADTRGFSFAELEEAKKLLVMRYVQTRRWDWGWVRQAMLPRHAAHQPKSLIGFGAGTNGNGRHACGSARP